MRSSRVLQASVAALLIVAALAPLGCKAKSAAEPSSPAGGASVVASSAVATGAGVATGTSSPGGSSAKSSKITASEAAALDAELAAIQKELDKLSVPGDSDFGDIESGLK